MTAINVNLINDTQYVAPGGRLIQTPITMDDTSGTITTPGSLVGGIAIQLTQQGAGFLLNPATATGAANTTVTVNGRVFLVTFTSVSIAAGATLSLSIDNNTITGSSTIIDYSWFGATTGSALSRQSVTNGAGTSTVVFTNGTGATTSTENITLIGLVLN